MMDTTRDELDTDEVIVDGNGGPHVGPVPVEIVGVSGVVDTNEVAADFGSYSTVVFAGTVLDQPTRLLGEDAGRSMGWIIGSGVGPFYIGSVAQCNAVAAGNLAAGGILIPVGIPVPVGHRQEVWAISDRAHAVNIGVINERRNTA